MSIHTTIQWTDGTVNPTMGCDGCPLWNRLNKRCYAGKTTRRFGGTNPGLAKNFDVVELAPGRMAMATCWRDLSGTARRDKPWLNDLPRLIFVSDMSDALSQSVTFGYLRQEIIEQVSSELGRRHQWQWLTKRPARMARFSRWLTQQGVDWPTNLWAGTSIMTQSMTKGINHLLNVGDERTIRFLSVEPQWESIDLSQWLPQLDWVIQGGESGAVDHPFDLAWADELFEQCAESGVAYFLKQLGTCVREDGERLRFADRHGGDWSQWPRRLRVRQMPINATTKHRGVRGRHVDADLRRPAFNLAK
ncbi:MAG: phage Gp37/Gp68 family protein [Planctomycetes bacterium]|nr:phage Gp37/Gp68 family protein [Planctomycetota bacterium]